MLENMKLKWKLVAIALSASVPGILLLVLLIQEKNIAIDFSRKEFYGNAYLRPLRQAQEHFPAYQLAALKDAEDGDSEELLKQEALLAKAIQDLEAVDRELGSIIDARPYIESLKGSWTRLRETAGQVSAAAFEGSSTRFRQEIRKTISFVGDDSNLILDPDLDSYYMMDATLLKIPMMADLMTECSSKMIEYQSGAKATTEDRLTIITLLGQLESLMLELETNMKTGFRNNGARNLQPVLQEPLDTTAAHMEKYADAIRNSLSTEGGTPLTPERHNELAAALRASVFNLWDLSIDKLDVLLEARIDGFEQRKLQAIFSVLIVVLLSGVVVFYISGRLSSRVNNLATVSDRLAKNHSLDDSDRKALQKLVSTDEVGALAESVGDMAQQLASYIENLRASGARLEESNRTLEARVEERTKEIQGKNAELESALTQVTEAQKRLVTQEKLASLGALTAGIAHEIKNPLNFVNNFAELSTELVAELEEVHERIKAKVTPEDGEQIEEVIGLLNDNLKKIAEHGKRADGIVKGMLSHSRGAAGQMVPTDLNELLREYTKIAYHGLRAQDQTFNITIDFDLDSSLPHVPLVTQDFSRAVLNIVNNGCYATHERKKAEGEKHVPVITVRSRDVGKDVEIRIRDNGKGISKEKLEKIFEPFFTTKPTGAGTGLGLSITYDIIVQLHRGSLRVESVEGEYAEFIITVPKQAAQG